MRNSTLVLLIAMPLLCAGCSFTQNVRRNVALAPIMSYTQKAEHHRNTELGREAFRQMALQYSEQQFSCDYRKGFVEGFADYLDYGGTGEPPPIPTYKYRSFSYMTPEGLAAMEDWKLGWRHGGATAKVSHLRELNTYPVFWGPTYNLPPTDLPNTPPAKKNNETKLPAPRKTEEATDTKPADAAPKVEPPK